MREKSDRDSNFKSFINKNVKVSFLNFRISKFNKFNYNDNVKISHIYKNNENKNKKTISKLNIKNLFIFIMIKKIILNLIV